MVSERWGSGTAGKNVIEGRGGRRESDSDEEWEVEGAGSVQGLGGGKCGGGGDEWRGCERGDGGVEVGAGY